MEVIKGFETFSSFSSESILAIGNFDGIHLGHQKILQLLEEKAKKHSLPSLVLTFSPHPEKILGKKIIKMIQTLEQRVRGIKKFGIDAVLIVPFDEKFSSLTGQDFIQKIVVNILKAKVVIVGENFRFGKNREGDISLLRQSSSRFNFQVYSIPPVVKDGMVVSSSLIRSSLQEGKIEIANDLLGRRYEIEGSVIKGKSRGKALGFPTANIETENEIIPPGVFITTSWIDSKSFPSLTNVGNRPTFHKEETIIESFIINLNKNLYGEKIRVNFIKKIRNEMRFKTPEDLSQQIKKDLKKAKDYFSKVRA
ncbi:MAG: bifunctional riboflavin kinase/FAD synthetase [Candidatus Aminicenantes bacterium]|nr:bifunctional riboflavin kinase/FAD synthetase [Candidatus Aminicenantes bacterium]